MPHVRRRTARRCPILRCVRFACRNGRDSHAEYKQVTVLFADVVHSMDIAAALGAERLREIMTALFNHSSTVVQRYGGTVDKFTGDGIMAVFGAPIALEDHAVRACRAALDIQKGARTLAVDVEHRDKVTLQLRVGLNSGEVIAGKIGSGPLAYTTVGEQVGMAQRMESVAPPGGVMVSESTARLVEKGTMLGDPELVHIKGAHDPLSARRLLAMVTGQRADRVEPSSSAGSGKWVPSAESSIARSTVMGRSSVSSARPESARAEPFAKSPRGQRVQVSRCSQLTANLTPLTSHSMLLPVCCEPPLVRTVWTALRPGHRSGRGFRGRTMRIC